ncbi:hypothetical protein ACJ41O_008383 [Fusarium nematophilum]
MATHTPKAPCLTGLPIEILLEIYHQLGLGGVFNLAATHRTFYELLNKRKASILLPVLARDFSPFDELLQVYTASADDLEFPGGLYAPRKVVFKRFIGDTGTVLAPRPAVQAAVVSVGSNNGFTTVSKASKPNASHPQALKAVVLTEQDLKPLLGYCQLVSKWQARFPQMRWFHESENCRHLRRHEAERFRRAMYRWWLYGFYFHGDFPRPRVGLPEPGVDDIRLSQLRRYSTAELVELMDLVETMKDVVLHYLCPRLDPNQELDPCDSYLYDAFDRPESLTRGWRDQSRWGRIVKTYCKLGPKELMHLFDNIYSFPRKRLIMEARLLQPSLAFDQESISVAIQCVLDEREWSLNMPSLPHDGVGGVLDWDDERDGERLKFGDDARPDGSLPGGTRLLRSSSHYSPRGDDGSFLEDIPRHSWVEGRYMVSFA